MMFLFLGPWYREDCGGWSIQPAGVHDLDARVTEADDADVLFAHWLSADGSEFFYDARANGSWPCWWG